MRSTHSIQHVQPQPQPTHTSAHACMRKIRTRARARVTVRPHMGRKSLLKKCKPIEKHRWSFTSLSLTHTNRQTDI
jgi:hypothetical protein